MLLKESYRFVFIYLFHMNSKNIAEVEEFLIYTYIYICIFIHMSNKRNYTDLATALNYLLFEL